MSAGPLSLGATSQGWGTFFRVWAPQAESVDVVLETPETTPMTHPMKKSPDGYFSTILTTAGVGDFYRYRVDGKGAFPDPASRFQPEGVHGPSQIVDPSAFAWTDWGWNGVRRADLIFYELHIGTFTPEGTFAGAAAKLPELCDLGITAVELMPVADFSGSRNWGYDGVALFAPARCYGAPDDLRRLVDSAHALGLAVFLDVVYNHMGPDGAYHSSFSPYYISNSHNSPWGEAFNLDGIGSEAVRDYFIENAVRWITEYHFDGLRLDATHAMIDDSPRHIVGAICSAVRVAVGGTRRIHVICEDVRNLNRIVRSESEGGWGLDGVWSDDFHHQMRRSLAGDQDGYYQDFDGSTASIADTARKGWFFCGQYASYFGKPRGSDPSGITYSQLVFFIQNHDQVGNRAFGERLHHEVSPAAYRAASALLLLLPEAPLLFMGQEWAASTPFLFFTDHIPQLGRKVTEGRRREFRHFAKFSDPKAFESIPDPQDRATFEASRLLWEERASDPHSSVLRLFRALLRLRRAQPAMHSEPLLGELEIEPYDEDVLVLRRGQPGVEILLAVIRLRGSGTVELGKHPFAQGGLAPWDLLLSTDDPAFAPEAPPLTVDTASLKIDFSGPAAVVLHAGKDGR